jgi:hypothetical protein
VVTDLIKLLAQNVTSFTKKYTPQDHPRIMKYLRTRAIRQVVAPSFLGATVKGKGKGGGPPKRQKVQKPTQRAWAFVQEPSIGLTPPSPYQSKGNSYTSKGKGKHNQDKGKGKLPSKRKGKGKQKGDKGKGPPKGKSTIKGTNAPRLLPTSGDVNHGHLKCHFYHALGHIKPNCLKWLALQTSDTYKQRNSHEPKYLLIYDHLEDSILGPRLCQYCSDSNCDGYNCESPFDQDDYNEASMFFTQTLSSLVVNAKLERPLDSHAPQTEQLYMYEGDAWGETQEDEDYNHWESSDAVADNYEVEENYAIEGETEEDQAEEEPLYQESEDFDEDDQDNYS